MTMPYGHSTRAVSSPIASGQRGRFSGPRRFLPLSQFFLQQEKPAKGEKVIFGRQEPEKKKAKEKTAASTELPKSEERAERCGSVAVSTNRTKPTEVQKRRRRYEKEKGEKDEGITTTANVPTVPVPIGAGDGRKFLDRPGDKAKKKQKPLSTRMGVLLRNLF